MSFSNPYALLLLAIPIWLLGWVWKRSTGRVALPFDHGKQRSGTGARILVELAESLPALLLAVVILLIAGPQKTGEPRTRRKLTNIEFCVDISMSMSSPFGNETRYDVSMKAINEFLDFRKGDAFGLTFFGNNVLHWVPLTSDTSAFRCAPPFMKPEMVPIWMGGTEIGKALLACKTVLCEREEGDRMIVLVTDGLSADLFNGNDVTVGETLKQNNITVFAVHVDEKSEVPPPIGVITSMTGGEVFAAGDPEALKAIFKRIDSMKQTQLEKTTPETLDNFAPYCIAAISILGTTTLALFGLRYTPW